MKTDGLLATDDFDGRRTAADALISIADALHTAFTGGAHEGATVSQATLDHLISRGLNDGLADLVASQQEIAEAQKKIAQALSDISESIDVLAERLGNQT